MFNTAKTENSSKLDIFNELDNQFAQSAIVQVDYRLTSGTPGEECRVMGIRIDDPGRSPILRQDAWKKSRRNATSAAGDGRPEDSGVVAADFM